MSQPRTNRNRAGCRQPTRQECRQSAQDAAPLRSQHEVAAILGITQRAVWEAERRALRKLRLGLEVEAEAMAEILLGLGMAGPAGEFLFPQRTAASGGLER